MASCDSPDLFSEEASRTVVVIKPLMCDPCSEDEQFLLAEGFCVDCSHYLCTTCYQHHRTPKLSRHHKLLDKYQMPKQKPATTKNDECAYKCGVHKNQVITHFCQDHEQLGCKVCMALDHKTCMNVDNISKLSDTFLDSQEYKDFKDTIDSLIWKSENIQASTKRNIEDDNAQSKRLLDEIYKFRKEIDDRFNELEKELINRILKFKKGNHKKLNTISNNCSALTTSMRKMEREIDLKQNNDQRYILFVKAKMQYKSLERYNKQLIDNESTNCVPTTQFIPCATLLYFIRDECQKMGFYVTLDTMCNFETSNGACNSSTITNFAPLSNGNVALVDEINQSIKVVDTRHNIVIASRTMRHCLFGITAVSEYDIAVMQNGDIKIYTVTDEITLKKTILNTGIDNLSLVYDNNKFIGVTTTASLTPQIRIVNMNGDKVKTFTVEVDGRSLFEDPLYIAVNHDRSAIYVTDCKRDTLTCLSFEGEVRAQYKSRSGWIPRGLAVSRDGMVFVCDSHNNTIHIFSSDLQKTGVIHCEKFGIIDPHGLAHCDREHKLYVGLKSVNRFAVLAL